FANDAGTAADYLTLAYDSTSGTQMWVATYDGGGGAPGDYVSSVGGGIAASPDGTKVFVNGVSYGGVSTGDDYATVAYNASSGGQLWVSRYDSPTHGLDSGAGLAVSPNSSKVVVTGITGYVAPVGGDQTTIAYNASTGAQLWVQTYNGSANGTDQGIRVAMSPTGKRGYVEWFSQDKTTGYDFLTTAYNTSTGATAWKAT